MARPEHVLARVAMHGPSRSASPPRASTSLAPAPAAPLLRWLAVLALAVLPHAWVQLGTAGLVDPDGYYHIRYAALLRHALPRLSFPFPWLPTTILNPDEFTDHHLLFHLALVPFTFGDLIVGAKVAAVLFAAAATLCWFLVARGEGVRAPVLWLLVLLGSSPGFLLRMSMTRRQSLTLPLLLLAVHLVLERRPRWLVALGFVFVWLYDGWPVLIAVTGIATLALWAQDRRIEPWQALAPLAGVVVGTVIHPYFPRNAIFTFRHLIPKLGLSSSFDVPVAMEWYPYSASALSRSADIAVGLPLLGLPLAAYVLRQRRWQPDGRLLAWGGCAFLYLALLLNSRRFVEHEPAFAVMFTAVAWTQFLETARGEAIVRWLSIRLRPLWLPVLALLATLALFTGGTARQDVATTERPTRYAGPATWLVRNTPVGERVFATDWDDFPRLFFYDTHNVYLIGLDPTYMSQHDPDLYRRWRTISAGRVSMPAAEIRDRFGARWVFSDRRHAAFLRQARADPGMRQVFADTDGVVFVISPS